MIEDEINLLRILGDNNIPVSLPVISNSGKFIHCIEAPEGIRYCVLFTYAEGEKKHLITATHHYQIGKLMADLHLITQNHALIHRTTYTTDVLLKQSLPALKEFLDREDNEYRFMENLMAFLLTLLADPNTQTLPKGSVHLDIWFENLNITDSGKATLFDFDFCGNGWLALDIAFYVMQLHNIERYEESEYAPKLEQFIQGYESVRPLTKQEKEFLPALGLCLYFYYLGIQCERFENWSNVFISDNYLKRYINGIIKRYFRIYYPEIPDNTLNFGSV